MIANKSTLITHTLQAFWDRCLAAQRAADAASSDLMGAALVRTEPTTDEARDLAAYLAAQTGG